MWLEEYEKSFNSFQLATLFNEKSTKAFRGAAIALRRLERDTLAEQFEKSAAELEAAQQEEPPASRLVPSPDAGVEDDPAS